MAKKIEQEIPQPQEATKAEPVVEKKVMDERIVKLLQLLDEGRPFEEALGEVTQMNCDPNNPRYVAALGETEGFCEEHGLEHSQIECFTAYIEEILAQFSAGEITKELLLKMWKSFIFDREMETAFEAGVVKGRNMQIEALRVERENGDGLGDVSAGSTIEHASPKLGYIEQLMKSRR